MRALLSRYKLGFPQKLVYMLQATEYKVSEYLRWFWRTQDFDTVAQRKDLDKTQKAIAMLLAAYALALGVLVLIVLLLIAPIYAGLNPYYFVILALLILFTYPYIEAHLLAIPLWLGQIIIQKPKEKVLIRRARQSIAQHSATKIAIAGSYGKTTFRETLKTILSSGKKVAAPPSSYNTELGLSEFAQKLDGDEEIIIFELGESHAGDVRKLCKLTQPGLGVITGINEAHLLTFKSLDQTVKTIFELDEYADGRVYKNGESRLVKKHAKGSDKYLYTADGVNGWKVLDVSARLEGTSFVAKRGNKEIKVESGLLGLHQVGPLVAMVDIADHLGLSEREIEAGMKETKPFSHRLEPTRRFGNVVVIDDTYNGNPDGARAAISLLETLPAERRIYVTPGFVEMGNRHEQVHLELGKELAGVADLVVLIKNSATPFIAKGLKKAGFKGEILWFDDPDKCYRSIDSITKSGDVVVLQNDWPEQYL